MLDVALVEISGGQRLLVLDAAMVAVYRQPPVQPARWELETALPIVHSRPFPRDLRGRLLLRHDHLFDAYLPGVVCRSNSSPPLALTCAESAEPWPLSSDDSSPRAFFAASRNFFTGALSPGVGRIANVPSFYSAAPLLRPNDSLWAFAGVEGTLHLVDGNTDQVVRGKWGSSVASVRSGCGLGSQLLVSENGDSRQDGLRALEIPDRDPVASALADLQGRVSALWTETSGSTAIAISRRKDTGWYEAYRVSVSCGN